MSQQQYLVELVMVPVPPAVLNQQPVVHAQAWEKSARSKASSQLNAPAPPVLALDKSSKTPAPAAEVLGALRKSARYL